MFWYFRALSSLTGYSVGTHHVEEHVASSIQIKENEMSSGDQDKNDGSPMSKSSKPIGSAGMEGSTDVYIYGVDAQEQLVKTDEMIR